MIRNVGGVSFQGFQSLLLVFEFLIALLKCLNLRSFVRLGVPSWKLPYGVELCKHRDARCDSISGEPKKSPIYRAARFSVSIASGVSGLPAMLCNLRHPCLSHGISTLRVHRTEITLLGEWLLTPPMMNGFRPRRNSLSAENKTPLTVTIWLRDSVKKVQSRSMGLSFPFVKSRAILSSHNFGENALSNLTWDWNENRKLVP